MSIFINNSLLSRIFANNKPVRKVEAANADGTGQEVVFNTLPFNINVYLTSNISTFTLRVENNSPYDETMCFCIGNTNYKEEHAEDLDKLEDYLESYEYQNYSYLIDSFRNCGCHTEFTVQANSSRQFTFERDDSVYYDMAIRLLRKKDNGEYKLNFYNGSLVNKYERYLIGARHYWGGSVTKTYTIDETIV